MSPSETKAPAPKIELHVSAGDPATEIFLLDSQLQLYDRGIGKLQSSVAPGLYKLKLQTGNQVREEFLTAAEDSAPIVLDFEPLIIASAAPLEHSAKSHEFHQSAAQEYNQHTHVSIGSGSWIYLFVREWTTKRPSANPSPAPYPHPAQGLTLHDAQGELLVDYVASSSSNLQWEPCAGCNVQISPGFYRLRLTLPTGDWIEQSVFASPGWQTQIYLLQSDYHSDPDQVRRADLAGATIRLSHSHSFDPNSQSTRLAELARLGLVKRRSILSVELRGILHEKFDDPMLGIFGAHLLLMEPKVDYDLLSVVITNLRNLLNLPHPDVEALALQLATTTDIAYRFEYPPMLARSWNLVVQATVRRPELVPADSLAASMASHRWGTEPWLLWMGSESAPIVLDLPTSGAMSPMEESNVAEEENEYESAVRQYFDRSAHEQKGSLESATARAASGRPIRDGETMQQLVMMLGLPRNEVESILNKLYG